MKTKICNKCNTEKSVDEFHFNELGKDGYHCQCKECKNNYKKEYNKTNRHKRQEYRLKNKHVGLWRSVLKMSLKRLNTKKEGYTIDVLGYSALVFKEYIEKLFTENMSWENHGEWHIDHKKPVSAFGKDQNPILINMLCNLQPLWAVDNLKKGSKWRSNAYKKESE